MLLGHVRTRREAGKRHQSMLSTWYVSEGGMNNNFVISNQEVSISQTEWESFSDCAFS